MRSMAQHRPVKPQQPWPDAALVAARLAARIEPLCRTLLPGGHRVGGEWECGDLSGAPGRSLKVSLRGAKAGLWSDFAVGSGGDALDLVAAVRGQGLGAAIGWALAWLSEAPSAPRPDAIRPTTLRASTASDTRSRSTALARRLWRATVPAAGSPVEVYLRARAIPRPPPADLRFHPVCRHPSGQSLPAMVAAVRDLERRLVAVHRTFLANDGRSKATVEPVRAALGLVRGGAVRLGPIGPCLVVAEGIESAIAAAVLAGSDAAWATLGTAGLQALTLPPLPLASRVLIHADGDVPGVKAAEAAAARWRAEQRRVVIVRAPPGADANDVLGRRT